MDKQRILIHLDTDPLASAFDAIVAIDAGADQLLTYAQPRIDQVQGIVQGALFTRGPQDLKRTAVFIGGSDVAAAQQLRRQVESTFFGPFRVSLMCDPNGSNTTAAAAVLLALQHVPEMAGQTALVLGGTGPVGSRVAHLLGRQGVQVLVASRVYGRAKTAAQQLAAAVGQTSFQPVVCAQPEDVEPIVSRCALVFAAGAAGVSFVGEGWLDRHPRLQFAADLNAVPPLGLPGIDAQDAGRQRGAVVTYGAFGVGALKMKLHKQALRQLFERHDQTLDVEEIFALGQSLVT